MCENLTAIPKFRPASLTTTSVATDGVPLVIPILVGYVIEEMPLPPYQHTQHIPRTPPNQHWPKGPLTELEALKKRSFTV